MSGTAVLDTTSVVPNVSIDPGILEKPVSQAPWDMDTAVLQAPGKDKEGIP